MDPTEEAELDRLLKSHAAAKDWERETVEAVYAFVQRYLQQGKHGEAMAEMRLKTGWSRQRLTDIKAGRWSRNPDRNPPGSANQ
jgi:hypothetical protein